MVLVLDLSCLLQGTTCVYTTFLQPFVSRHELDIDQNLNELRIRAGEMAVVWWQRGSVYAQAHFYELLDYMASQSKRAHPTISPPVHPGNSPQTPCEPTQVPPQVCACLPLFSMLCWQLQNLLQKSNRTSGGRVV
jgi:receptor expression-enhancing protein 1/2/3/4